MKSGWHFVGKDKNPAGRHRKAEHLTEGTVLTKTYNTDKQGSSFQSVAINEYIVYVT